jgi:hypothetical protein
MVSSCDCHRNERNGRGKMAPSTEALIHWIRHWMDNSPWRIQEAVSWILIRRAVPCMYNGWRVRSQYVYLCP